MRTASADHIEELTLIAMSRLQRETLDRWMVICADAGEFEHAEAIRQIAQAETDNPEPLERAA